MPDGRGGETWIDELRGKTAIGVSTRGGEVTLALLDVLASVMSVCYQHIGRTYEQKNKRSGGEKNYWNGIRLHHERRVPSHPPGENLPVWSDLLVPQLIPKAPAFCLQNKSNSFDPGQGLTLVREDQGCCKLIRDLAPAFPEGYR